MLVAFSTVPKSTCIVSKTSTALSSNPLFEITIDPEELPGLITNGDSVKVYSSWIVAVPEAVNGIEMVLSETLSSLTVMVIVSSKFSCKYFLLDSKAKLDGTSLSVNVIVISSDEEKVPDVEE